MCVCDVGCGIQQHWCGAGGLRTGRRIGSVFTDTECVRRLHAADWYRVLSDSSHRRVPAERRTADHRCSADCGAGLGCSDTAGRATAAAAAVLAHTATGCCMAYHRSVVRQLASHPSSLNSHTHIQVFIRLRGSGTLHLATKLNLTTSHNLAPPLSYTNFTLRPHKY